MTALEQTEQAINVGDYVVTYSGKIGKVVGSPWMDMHNGEELVTVEVDGKCHPEGTADLTLATVEDAWNWLQSSNSYVEQMAKAFANETGLEIEDSHFDPFTNDFNTQYELARRIGDQRFGSECTHSHTLNGHCINCLRQVVTQ